MAIFEYLRIGPEIRKMIAGGKDAMQIEQAARADGQANLRDDALRKFRAGQTTLQEVMKVVT
jgi:type II secretory ATPase GspE/PulE/Tfp pilus assembly ATPase PilB-like protein